MLVNAFNFSTLETESQVSTWQDPATNYETEERKKEKARERDGETKRKSEKTTKVAQ